MTERESSAKVRPPSEVSKEAVVPVGNLALPSDARDRLAELGDAGTGRGLFTSDLSVNEFLLLREARFHARGLVLGSSIFHLGLQFRRWRRSQELTVLSQAMYSARELAMARMEEEADILGADGVVGVRLDVNFYDWGRHSAEFIAIGTAVSAEAGTGWRTQKGLPFTSDLSGQDFWTLLQAGYAPIGLVMGTCVYHVAHRSMLKAATQFGQNTELPNFTEALYQARECAMARMQEEATAGGADGIVGVQLVERSHFWGSHVIEFLAIGTAVRSTSKSHTVAPPSMIITLDH